MTKKLLFPLFLLIAATTLSACGNPTPPPGQRDTVSVQGEGSVKGQPDTFILVVTASEQGSDVASMKEKVDAQISDLLAMADDLGIDDKHVTASSVRITPQWQYQPERKLLGYQVDRDVTFRVKGMDRYARLTDGVTKAGITNMRPGGAEISNADELTSQALKKAVADAQAKAKLLAEAAGRKLGQAITITSHSGPVPGPVPMVRMMAAKADSSSSYSAGQQDVTATVNITFELQ